MTNKIAIVISLVAVIIAIYAVGSNVNKFGGTTNYDALTLDSGNLTLSNGNIVQVTSNTATSSATLGCIQRYPTSTATAVYETFSPYAGTTTTSGATSNFLVAANYGTCPK